MVLLRTKHAAKLETHQGLINVPVIDQLNSDYPHNFLGVFHALNPSASSPCMPQSPMFAIIVIQTEVLSHLIYCMRVIQDLIEMLKIPGYGPKTAFILSAGDHCNSAFDFKSFSA